MHDLLTTFTTFWQALNAELANRSLPEAGFGQANDAFKIGYTVEEAADMVEREHDEHAQLQMMTEEGVA
jgi:hypothetical protein